MENRLTGIADDPAPIREPVYVTGLARSGTTIVLEKLSKHPATASHRYRDFPFVMTPVAWNWFLDRASPREHTPAERAHRDRILVTPDSPEAMEEMVWMAFYPDCHDPAVCNVLGADADRGGFADFYRSHIRKLLVVRGGDRYVAKGNYNLSRLEFISAIFPDARFVIPIREPVGHVASLIKQHKLFCDAECEDVRVLNHMRRVGHFEFGLDRRPVNFGSDAEVARIRDAWDAGDEARGWAAMWAATYSHVDGMLAANGDLKARTLIVRYDALCRDPSEMLAKIFAHCRLEDEDGLAAREAQSISEPSYYNPGLSEKDVEAIRTETADVAARYGFDL